MDYESVAAGIIDALGGEGNVTSASTCLTRLRLSIADVTAVDLDALKKLRGVLGVASRGSDSLEVVFGPTAIEGVSRAFALQTNLALSSGTTSCANPLARMRASASEAKEESKPLVPKSLASSPNAVRIQIPAGRMRSYRAQQQAAIDEERLSKDDIEALKDFLSEEAGELKGKKASHAREATPAIGRSVLVINGPNINMLGRREPDIYGKQDYAALLRTCKDAARKAGFSDIKCFQSNHEGAIVDEIQAALDTFDGIVINPAAYTHTSVAILDALKAVQIPCIEVHISKVEDREDFRQVSYVRQACFETITGLGIEGYRKAINDLAKHLGM